MATRANPKTVAFARAWEDVYPSAVFSGIVGDRAHRARGGPHISIEDQPASNYSVTRVDDKAPPGNWARDESCGVDMSASPADMRRQHSRLVAVFRDRSDPRRKYINAFNGYDGQGDAGRYDMVTNTVSVASPDHKTHEHLEFKRRYVNDPEAYRAALSILRGETVAQYLAGGGTPTPESSSTGDDDMAGVTVAGEPIGAYLARIERALWWQIPSIAAAVAESKAREVAMAATLAEQSRTIGTLVSLVQAGGGDINVAPLAAQIGQLTAQVAQLLEQETRQTSRLAELEAELEQRRRADAAAAQAQADALGAA